ncbi:PAAR domain-containing protein [Pseudomonas tussilaginis]|uniref:PAAR domain-containing protein n=1 Tax=unclassified Pseudomonas TaxID=196821 RepID=UPI001E463EE8|nr:MULTISPECIES: PAAR domain-containing protein [unclassified Pseudomonas]
MGALAIAAMIGAGAATGAGIGQLIGRLSFACHEAGQIDKGSGNVHINGQPAARVGDRTVCDAKISAGSPNVCIGGGTETTDEIDPEVPVWLELSVMGIGLASAVVLVGPAMAAWGLLGGVLGGTAGYKLGGDLYGEDSNQQKLLAFGGAFLGGGLSARYKLQPNGGLGSNLGNVKITKRAALPLTPKAKGVSPEVYQKLRARTPSKEIQAMVNKDVALPMKDPALPGLEITKPLYADHVVPMKQITEMNGFNKLAFDNQLEVLNYKPNSSPLSETANTSRGAKTYEQWTRYRKGGIDVDPSFRSSMMGRSAELEIELQEKIYSLLP